ncbi:MarR family winged helix-turn-helix transcriptional regulator [Proteocatella sphenisci]|uniref:MarR family winged helix-turn-helix transcriptional regulator n=1 Tax=Proteocatella sphenisci TaxID=181070 RepID=UPI000491EBE3|nr:MarR family transcriptional regulator [Proteocatella sphenisci]
MNDKYIVYFISRTKQKMIQFIEQKLEENGVYDLITSHGNILTALYENNGKLTMSQIAKKIGKDKSTVTPLITKLFQLGYIDKLKNDDDKRITYITITDKGRQLESTFNSITSQVHETAYKNFTPEEKQIFLELLKKLNMNFTKL